MTSLAQSASSASCTSMENMQLDISFFGALSAGQLSTPLQSTCTPPQLFVSMDRRLPTSDGESSSNSGSQRGTNKRKLGSDDSSTNSLPTQPVNVASVFEKPTSFIADFLSTRQTTSSGTKRLKLDAVPLPSPPNARLSFGFPPTSNCKPAPVSLGHASHQETRLSASKPMQQDSPCSHHSTLNLAIMRRASASTLKTLVHASASVLQKQGEREYPLHVLLKHKPTDLDTFEFMVSKNPKIMTLADSKGNTPLHTIVLSARKNSKSVLPVIRRLCQLYPKALRTCNDNGATPLELAQQRSQCPDEIAKYLWEQIQKM